MKKVLWGMALVVGMACGVSAQEAAVVSARADGSASNAGDWSSPVTLASDAGSFSLASSSAIPSSPEPAAADPATPKYVFFGDRDDYRWQLGVGFDYVHFDSRAFNVSMYGLNTTLTYYTNSWFAVEGSAVEVFGPTLFGQSNHAKMFTGMGGFRIGGRRARWEPFGHALVGGSHLQVQTAYGGRTALAALAGVGVDFRVHSRLSLRGEADWIYTGYFSQTQNNVQALGGVVLHF